MARNRMSQKRTLRLSVLTVAGTALAIALGASALAQNVKRVPLGRPALPQEIEAWNHDIRPDGVGLPPGSGSVKAGEELFLQNCAVCHGEFGEGVGKFPVLVGGRGTLTHDQPDKTVGSYWPYASTIYDYVRRAMPFGNAQSLTPDQAYALTAYILYMNDIVKDDFVLSRENFTSVHMPNEANFYDDDREKSEKSFWRKNVCMKDCKKEVKITGHASVVDVTPDSKKGPKVD